MCTYNSSKRHDLIDMFNDTSRYLDDIFTIDNPEFEKYITYIEHMQRVRHANRGRLLLRTPGPVPLWDLHVF